ncbi:ABC transporter substrate-binding protein [Microlunatus sp. Y2014]|uniref:ABC transporter substrate-binding protein n=1 Tax=Microlunatus sp. Y2014 TaxID=3418488 RepID=UPI003DA7660F
MAPGLPEGGEVRPSYFAYDGPTPDLTGDGAIGIPHGYLTFPDPPDTTGQTPLELSAPVEFLVQGLAPVTPSDRNQWWQKWKSDLGQDFTIVATDSTQYTAKFQTSVAGGVLGDLTQIVSVPRLPEVLESSFTDLTPYLSGDNVKKYPNLANIPSAAWDMCMIGGKLWGVTNPRIVAGSVLMTQGDLLDAKGIDTMPDIADGEAFLDLCREVTDPSAGIFAIGQQPHAWTVPLLMESLGGTNGWKVESGTWTSAYEDPAFERALEIVTTMWSDRLIHPNSYSQLSSTALWFDGGTTALFAQSIASWQNRLASAPFPVGVAVMPKWDGGGRAAKHLGAPGYGAPVGLKKLDDEDRIDELLRVMDYIASPFGTEEYLEPPRRVRRLRSLGRMESCQGVHRRGIRPSCVSGRYGWSPRSGPSTSRSGPR